MESGCTKDALQKQTNKLRYHYVQKAYTKPFQKPFYKSYHQMYGLTCLRKTGKLSFKHNIYKKNLAC